jgi:osmoprotectant transport system permease protein
MHDFVDSFSFMAHNTSLLWHKTLEHLGLSGAAIGIALAVAIPVGAWLGHVHRGSFVAINISNIGRALPSLVVILVGITFLGVSWGNVVLALVVLAVPPMLTNAYVAVSEVDREAVEAARGMGMRPLQVFARVELPMALPLTFAGIRTASTYVVATATLAGIAGGGGLGDIIVNQASYHLSGVIAGAIWVALLALLVDVGLGAVQRALTPAGLRRAEAPLIGPSAYSASSSTPRRPERMPAASGAGAGN